jgi:hypothetical protein
MTRAWAGIKDNTKKEIEIHRTLPVVFNKTDVMFTDINTCETKTSFVFIKMLKRETSPCISWAFH